MEDLDFTKPSRSAIYDPATALEFFQSAGSSETVAQGDTFFVERRKRRGLFRRDDRMYLLVEGEVTLTIGNKVIDTLRPGEVFGEMAPITEMPRSATAVAKTPCRALAIKKSRFHKALGRKPEFALMLMNIMINRLRLTDARLGLHHALPRAGEQHQGRVFEKAVLADLLREAGNLVPLRFVPGKAIMTAGEKGHYMYVVLEGRVVVTVQDKVVESVGPGGVLGEMALIDDAPRAASAIAEADCSLLPISRRDLLDLIGHKPEFGVALLKTLADRLRFMTAHLAAS